MPRKNLLDARQIFKLHAEGLNFFEIAKQLGYKESSLRTWAKRRGLVNNKKPVDKRFDEDLAAKMHAEGSSDGDIAFCMGCEYRLVGEWRKKNNLPPGVGQKKINVDRFIFLYAKGFSAEEISKDLGCSYVTAWHRIKQIENQKPVDEQAILNLYEQHKTDAEIAQELGIKAEIVFAWRKDNRFPPNKPHLSVSECDKIGGNPPH